MLLSKFFTALFFSSLSFGSTQSPSATLDIKTEIGKEIRKKYPGANIEVTQGLENMDATFLGSVTHVVLDRDEAGMAIIRLEGKETKNVRVAYRANVKAPTPKKRVLPHTPLTSDLFETQEFDVASGMGRQLRGVLLSPEVPFEGLESLQTLLEGQPVLSTAIQKTPDVRAGTPVQIQVTSGHLTLSTNGIAQEMATIGSQVRVTTGTSKRELIGKLVENKIVEVAL